jgi:hypothetical protein
MRRADPPSKESYQMSKNTFIRFRSQILNRKRPEGLIRIYFTLQVNTMVAEPTPLITKPVITPDPEVSQSRYSSVGIALGYGLDDWGSRVRFPAEAGNLSIPHRVQNGSGPTQSPIQCVPGALSLGVKQPEREADHSPLSSAEVKNAWIYTSTSQYASMAKYSVKAQGKIVPLPYKNTIKPCPREKWKRRT